MTNNDPPDHAPRVLLLALCAECGCSVYYDSETRQWTHVVAVLQGETLEVKVQREFN